MALAGDEVYGRRNIDLNLVAVVVLLLALGLIMVFSASFVRAQQVLHDPYFYLKRQAIWTAIGLTAMFVVANVQYWHWRMLARPLLYLTLAFLVVVLLPGIGQEVYGSQRWIGLGPLGFQPSELAKVALVVFLAAHFTRKQSVIQSFGPVFIPFLATVGAVCALILLQPDLGTVVAIAGTAVVLLFAAGTRLSYIFGVGLAAVPAIGYLIFAEEYRMRRIFAFLDPEADPLGAGYHIIQSLYALGSGGLFGVGFFEGKQKFYYLPAQHTDFIFAVLGEELGFLGAVATVLLFAAFAWRGYRIAAAAPDIYASLLATGVTTMVVFQAVMNIGVVTASLPITGISLPFVSYGGSSLIFTLIGVGILLNISRYSRV